MIQQSLQPPTRRSDRIKVKGYVNLNERVYYDKLFNIRRRPPKSSDCRGSLDSKRDEQQFQQPKHVSRPSTGSLGPCQVASTKPTRSSQEAVTMKKIGTGQLVELEFRPTSELKIQDRDNVTHHAVESVKQYSVLRNLPGPAYKPDVDDISRESPRVEDTSSAFISFKVPNSSNKTAKRRSRVTGSKDGYHHKKLRINDEREVISSENGPNVDLESSKEVPSSSTRFHLSQYPAAETKDLGSRALAAQSLSDYPDQQPAPQGMASRGSDAHSSLPSDYSSKQEGDSLSKEAIAPSKTDQDEFTDETVQGEGSSSEGGRSLFTAPSKADHDDRDNNPIHVDGTRPSVLTWILQGSKPVKEWVLWQGINPLEANLQFAFTAVVEHTGLKNIRSIEITLDTHKEFFTFRTSREDLAHYAEMQRFMKHKIETSCGEMHDGSMLPNIRMSPIETTQSQTKVNFTQKNSDAISEMMKEPKWYAKHRK